jgi:DNA replication protein DnaC
MNLIELNRSLVQLRLSGMAAVMETRLLQAQSENMAPIDLISTLVSDELACRSKRLLERRHKQAQFRDPNKLLDNFDFQFNPKMNRSLVFDLATANWIGKREDALFLGPPGSGKSHCAQAIGHAVIQQGYRVLYREAHRLLEELADATLDGKRKELMEQLTTVPLLIIDDLGMRKLPLTAAEELLEIIMRRYERASTLLTSNRLCCAPHNLFNAKSIIMRTPRSMDADCCHLAVFLLRIMGAALSRAISLSVALKRPVRSFGAITDSNASSFTLGSARV